MSGIAATFWELIESSGRNLRKLCRKLEELPKDQLRRYRQTYADYKYEVNPHCWKECHDYLSGDCSEDQADDFAAWVVMQGLAFFHVVSSHPEKIHLYLDMFCDTESGRGYHELRWNEEVDRVEYRGNQRADYIASPIYELRFGENLNELLEERD